MTDISPTAANVGISAKNANTTDFQAGEAVTQGQPVYKHTDGKYYRTSAAAAATAVAVGIVMSPAATNGDFLCALPGTTVDLGATLTVGETYVVSTNTGMVAPIGDLTTGDDVTHLGVATAADALPLSIDATGVTKP